MQISILTEFQENVKGLVHANFPILTEFQENVKGLVHANFHFEPNFKKM